MLDVSAAYTAAIKDKNRTDRITGTIKLCDGETINITDDIIVNNSVTLKEQLVSGDTFEIGTFYTNQLDITVYDDNFLTRSYANARISPKYEIQLADGTWESVPLGIFTVDNSLTKRKGSIHKLTAFDDSTKFDVDISAYSGGKKTVQQHIKELAADVGITLATTDFSSYPNYDLTVDSGSSTAIQTYRDLIEWCCALMAASGRINRYGKLEIVKLKEKTKTVDGTLVYDADYTVEGYERTGTEFFDLRALTKYFSTTFDGEQYVYKNSAMITASDIAARNATMFIPENPLLQSVSDRTAAFEACADAINIALRRVEFSFNGNPAIECFDTLCGNGGKIDVNRTIAFFPTSLVWKYRGAHKVSCAFAELTDEATASVSEMATFAAAVANKSPLCTKNKTDKRIDDVAKRANGVGKFTNADKNCEIFNDYENNTASSYYAHAEGYKTTANAPYSHAEGSNTVASNPSCHAEGTDSVASGQSSHAEGENCRATGSYSHAEGYKTIASGVSSHASGLGTVAEDDVTFAIGRWNKTSGGLFVVGNGWNSSSDESDARRSDALVLDTMGNLHIAGKLTADGGVDSSSDGGGSSGYTLPVATADTLGGVIIGDNLLVSESGIIAADLSECVKSDEIADWAKAENKPAYTAEEIGLGNVDNTADADKPISSAMQTALDGKADVSHKHTISDITDMPASLPASGGNADTVDGKHASDFAVAGHTHTAAEIGAAAKSHTHTKSQITDFPTLGTAAGKNIDYFATASHKHTAAEIGAATAANITAAVNAVSIGGRNIVTGSETLTIGTGKRAKGHWRTSGSSGNGEILGTFRESMPSCGEITAISIDCYTLGAEYGITQDNVPLDKDSYYTLSCWVRSGSSNNARCALQPFWKSSTDSGGRKYFVVGPSWTRLSFTSTKKPAATGNYSAGYVLAVPNDDYPEPTISVCGIKLEKGNKPTDWTPAPEDAERRITSLEARVAALEAAAVSGGEV